MSGVNERATAVASLLDAKKFSDAMKTALANPPYGEEDQTLLNLNAKTILSVVAACKDEGVDVVIADLDEEECDTLMKYLYRFLANAQSSTIVLRWHQSLTDKAGKGCIMRALTDRRGI